MTGETVKGVKHSRNGLPNQDALDWAQQGEHLVLALSDGHGSRKHVRSHLGARFAVEAAVEVILREADVDALTADMLPKIKERVEGKLPKRIVLDWQQRVRRHYTKHPFSKQELAEIAAAKGEKVKKIVASNPKKAYGATLLGILITEQFILYLQLGDGDILGVTSEGKVQRVFATGEEELGSATDSLCLEEPELYFNFCLQPLSEEVPQLVMAATDGYVNSFPYDEDFFQVGTDFLQLAREDGIGYIEDKLEDWLIKTSQEGSGDDITVGLVFRK